MMWYMNGGGGWWMLFGGLWMVVLWGGVIALVVWAVSRLTGRGTVSRDDPFSIARERYAKGEIDKKEFDEIKKGLYS